MSEKLKAFNHSRLKEGLKMLAPPNSGRVCYQCNIELEQMVGIKRVRYRCPVCGRSYQPKDSHALRRKK